MTITIDNLDIFGRSLSILPEAPPPDPVADDPRDLLARLLDLRGRFGMFDAIPVSQIDALTAATDSHPRATDHVVAILSRATGLPLDEETPVGHAEFAAARISNLAAACDERNALIDVLRAHGLMDRGAELAARLSAVLAAARAVAVAAPSPPLTPGPDARRDIFAAALDLARAIAAADGAR